MIPFGEWLPDLPALGNPGATVATNVIPRATSYGEMKGLSAFSDALTAYCRGAISVRDKSGTAYNYAGDETKLYSLSTATWGDVSKVGNYSTSSGEHWSFAKWGEKVIATNYADAIQIITLGGANFADLSGSPPKARHIGIVRDFVVLGNVNDGTARPNRVQWSGINDETSWGTVAATQADYQDLLGKGGWVQAVVPGEYGVIFQEYSIWRMDYVGPPVVFELNEVERGRGTPAPRSVVNLGPIVFYLGQDGFYMFDGSQSHPIGTNKVDDYFYNDLNSSVIDRVNAAIDRKNQLVIWAYPSGATSSTPDKLMIYHWPTQKWSTAEIDTQLIIEAAQAGYTMDGLASVNTNLDAIDVSLDSRFWTGSGIQLMAFDSSNKMSDFSGSALTATIETGEFQPFPNRRTFTTSVRPMVDGATSTTTISAGTRNLQNANNSFATPVSTNSIGECNMRVNSRYQRYRATITGGFDHAEGIEITAKPEGKR